MELVAEIEYASGCIKTLDVSAAMMAVGELVLKSESVDQGDDCLESCFVCGIFKNFSGSYLTKCSDWLEFDSTEFSKLI